MRKGDRIPENYFPIYYPMFGFLNNSLIESFSKLGEFFCHSLQRTSGQVQSITSETDHVLDKSYGNETNMY